MRKMYRRRDLIEALGVPKSTLADWLEEFKIFIPKQQDGFNTFYLEEAFTVLRTIQELRTNGYGKADILRILHEKNFPITVDEDADQVEQLLSSLDGRKHLVTLIEQMGEAVSQIANQEHRMTFLQEQQENTNREVTTLREQISTTLEEVQKMQAKAEEQREVPDPHAEEISKLQEQMASMNSRIQAVDEYFRLPAIVRWFKKPPRSPS